MHVSKNIMYHAALASRAVADDSVMRHARRLDMLADCELQQGHVAAAERLTQRAAELRGMRT